MDDIPPLYSAVQQASKQRAALDALPDNALLRVLSHCTFVDLHAGIRMTCKKLRSAAMAILRSAFCPQYSGHIIYPYSSDALAPRESQTFDLFIALLVTTNRLATESELHLLPLQSGHIPTELFALYQPRSRLEDLCGRKPVKASYLARLRTPDRLEILGGDLAKDLTIRFTKRKVSLLLPSPSNSAGSLPFPKTIAEVERGPEESLESSARDLARMVESLKLVKSAGAYYRS